MAHLRGSVLLDEAEEEVRLDYQDAASHVPLCTEDSGKLLNVLSREAA